MSESEAKVTPITKAAGFEEIGATGLKQQGGVLGEEFLRELQGDKARKAYREMADNDPVVGAILFAIDMLVRQVAWHVEAHDEDPSGTDTAEFVESCFNDMSLSWSDTVSSILSFLPFGWSYHEVVYKMRRGPAETDAMYRSSYTDGRIGWRKLPIRGQDTLVRWLFDEEGGIQGMEQAAPPDYVPVQIPMTKSLLFRTTAQKGNPEGRSVLRNAYRPWFFKKRIEEIEGIGIERDLAGFPVAYIPARLFAPDASVGDKQVLETIKKQVRNVKRNEEEGLVFPSVYDDAGHQLYRFELLNSGGRRQFDTDAIIARYDQRIAMVTLADFVLLGHEKVGSFALGESKAEMFTLALTTWLDSIAGVFNQHAIPKLLEINGLDPRFAPTLEHDDVRDVDLDELGQFIERMTGSAVITPDLALEEWIRERAGLPASESTGEL